MASSKEQKRENYLKWAANNPDKVKEHRKNSQAKRKEKNTQYRKQYYEANKDKLKALRKTYKENHRLNLIKRHGLTKEAFDEMLTKQNNSCAICNIIFTETPNIDHCHSTEKVRGLLCRSCNLGLGHFKDKEIFLLSAIEYLKR